jgi:hypothetical protein
MYLGKCPHLRCTFNIDGICHHALRPDPGDCEYRQPNGRALQNVLQSPAPFHRHDPQPSAP